MPNNQNAQNDCISLRTAIVTACEQVIEDASFAYPKIQSFICELIASFSVYTEEDKTLFLEAYVTDNLANMLDEVPNSKEISIGSFEYDDDNDSLVKALKKVAPLVRGPWKIFFHIHDNVFEYGLLRDSGHPVEFSIEETLSNDNSRYRYIRIHRINKRNVLAENHNGLKKVIDFYSVKRTVKSDYKNIEFLASAICKDVEAEYLEKSKRYCEQLLKRALHESHGTIIAVVDKGSPFEIPDAVVLKEQIFVPSIIQLSHSKPVFLPELNAIEDFIIGTFCCDGIVIFNTEFNFIGYNAFIENRPTTSQHGGARRRAFDSLCRFFDQGLVAAFMQSQDGYTYFQSPTCQE